MPTTRVEDYLARVAAEASKLSPEAAREYLDRLGDQWGERYGKFRRRVADGQPTKAGDHACDFLETIAGIDALAAPYLADEIAKWESAARKTVAFNATQSACADVMSYCAKRGRAA
jgi:hypothetical protein